MPGTRKNSSPSPSADSGMQRRTTSAGLENPLLPPPPESGGLVREAPANLEMQALDPGGHAPGLPEHLHATMWKPGQSGNPSGRRKVDPLVRDALVNSSLEAANTLIEIMKDKRVSPKVRCDAAQAILNRVYGKAVQPIDAAAGECIEPIIVKFVGELDEWAG